jgi:hypothetical protein
MSQNKRTMMKRKSFMKNTTVMMCLIAALGIFTLPADAARRVNQSIPVTLSVPVPCNNVGEVVDLSGTWQTVIGFTRNSRRGSVLLHVDTQGVAGTGEITGRGFQGNGEINISFRRSLLNGRGTTSFKTETGVTGPPGPDGSVISFCLQVDVHVTFNANGTVTVEFDNFGADCGCGAGLWDY